MARSVSYATGSVAKAYFDVRDFGCSYDDDGNCIESSYCEGQAIDDWEDWESWLSESLTDVMPSLTTCDKWLGREDRAILENDFVHIGLSEYCGVACLWMVPKDLHDTPQLTSLQAQWIITACDRIEELGQLRKLGTFSNGEAIFERKGD